MTEPTDELPDDWANSGQTSSPTSDPDDRLGPGAELSEEEETALRSGELERVTFDEATGATSTGQPPAE